MSEVKEKEYVVQNLGTPSRFVFPRIMEKGKVISEGRVDIEVKNGDKIKLLPVYAGRLIRQGYLSAKGDK